MVAPAPKGAIQNCPLSEWPQEKVSRRPSAGPERAVIGSSFEPCHEHPQPVPVCRRVAQKSGAANRAY